MGARSGRGVLMSETGPKLTFSGSLRASTDLNAMSRQYLPVVGAAAAATKSPTLENLYKYTLADPAGFLSPNNQIFTHFQGF